MNLYIKGKGKNLKATEALRVYVKKRMEKIKYYSDKIVDTHIVWEKVHEKNYRIEVTVMLEGKIFHCEEKGDRDLYEAIDLLFDKIERQILKTKEIVKNHRGLSIVEAEERLQEIEKKGYEDINTVHTNIYQISGKPMDDIEAYLQLKVNSKPYLAYFPVKKNETLVDIQIGKRPVFIVKVDDKTVTKVYYQDEKKGFLSGFLGPKSGWFKSVVEFTNNEESKVISEKEFEVSEESVSSAVNVLKGLSNEDFFVYINRLTGKVEGVYKDSGHTYSILRYGIAEY